MLEITGLECRYGKVSAVRDLSMVVNQGELVTLIGRQRGREIDDPQGHIGTAPARRREHRFSNGEDISHASAQKILSLGIAHCPEGRRIFPYMSVQENLDMGCYLRRDTDGIEADRRRVFERFPILEGRRRQTAGTLSGGEQQMLAIGRALMSRPKLVLFDEPSLGLAPNLVETTFEIIAEIRAEGVTVLMVEQNAYAALEICDRAYLLESGAVALQGTGAELKDIPHVREAYLGG